MRIFGLIYSDDGKMLQGCILYSATAFGNEKFKLMSFEQVAELLKKYTFKNAELKDGGIDITECADTRLPKYTRRGIYLDNKLKLTVISKEQSTPARYNVIDSNRQFFKITEGDKYFQAIKDGTIELVNARYTDGVISGIKKPLETVVPKNTNQPVNNQVQTQPQQQQVVKPQPQVQAKPVLKPEQKWRNDKAIQKVYKNVAELFVSWLNSSRTYPTLPAYYSIPGKNPATFYKVLEEMTLPYCQTPQEQEFIKGKLKQLKAAYVQSVITHKGHSAVQQEFNDLSLLYVTQFLFRSPDLQKELKIKEDEYRYDSVYDLPYTITKDSNCIVQSNVLQDTKVLSQIKQIITDNMVDQTLLDSKDLDRRRRWYSTDKKYRYNFTSTSTRNREFASTEFNDANYVRNSVIDINLNATGKLPLSTNTAQDKVAYVFAKFLEVYAKRLNSDDWGSYLDDSQKDYRRELIGYKVQICADFIRAYSTDKDSANNFIDAIKYKYSCTNKILTDATNFSNTIVVLPIQDTGSGTLDKESLLGILDKANVSTNYSNYLGTQVDNNTLSMAIQNIVLF